VRTALLEQRRQIRGAEVLVKLRGKGGGVETDAVALAVEGFEIGTHGCSAPSRSRAGRIVAMQAAVAIMNQDGNREARLLLTAALDGRGEEAGRMQRPGFPAQHSAVR
jgi:hypothetical protein